MNESNLWEWLRDVVLPVKGHYSRIESPDTAPGHPDVTYSIFVDTPITDWCEHGTIELKHSNAEEIPFPNEDKGLHKSQLKWIRDEVRVHGTVWIFAQIGTVILCIEGKHADRFNGATGDELAAMATEVLWRDQPESAAEKLQRLLAHG